MLRMEAPAAVNLPDSLLPADAREGEPGRKSPGEVPAIAAAGAAPPPPPPPAAAAAAAGGEPVTAVRNVREGPSLLWEGGALGLVACCERKESP